MLFGNWELGIGNWELGIGNWVNLVLTPPLPLATCFSRVLITGKTW
ncbi:MAG: hypothetical protein F6K47_29985 [Symploca sp. SIO2E6]|nr:hypothetical protein [Symploca sp. SIO2E6]